MYNIVTSKLDDKYYTKYKYLFNYSSLKFNLINTYLLYNFIYTDNNKVCNYSFNNFDYNEYYNNIFVNKNKFIFYKKNKFNIYYENYIIDKFSNNNTTLLIKNTGFIERNYTLLKQKKNIERLNIYNEDVSETHKQIANSLRTKNPLIDDSIFKRQLDYSSRSYNIYKEFLINLKNNEKIDSIPTQKYKLITCTYGYMNCLSLSASYKMTLQIPHLISTISMSLKLIEKNGTLLLFWSIVNINIPIIKKLLSLLSYGFKTIDIIDNDINQNLLIGVPEYYIKCSGYKDNISNELITILLDSSIKNLKYLYKSCDVLDYYEDYTIKNPNNSLFYNKNKEEFNNYNIKKTKKQSSTRKSSTRKSSTRKSSTRKSSTRKSSTRKSAKSTKSKKPTKPIYYIEDINIPELDKIMKDKKLMFKVDSLANKLETIFVGYFEMVNNLIVNSIAKDKKGNMYVKKEAIIKKDITNLSRLITMFEHNKLPYNKHALKVLLDKKDEMVSHFYSLDNPINIKLIQYDDKTSKYLNIYALNNFVSYDYLQKPHDLDILNDYYNRINLSLQVKNKLLEDTNKNIIQNKKYITYINYDFSINLSEYLNNKYKNSSIKINTTFLKIWEILSQFNLIPPTIEKKSLKIVYLDEFSGQIIMCVNHWLKTKCNRFKLDNYEWLANSFNPLNYKNKSKLNTNLYNTTLHTKLIKDNYTKWLWGDDNTGNLNNIENIKSIVNSIKHKWGTNDNSNNNTDLDLIISDGSLDFDPTINTLNNQKIELSKVISIIASSSIGSSCCSKHFIPSKTDDKLISNENDTTIDSTNFFIGYLYLYYIMFDSLSLYKPTSSNSNNHEFYVIGKKFKGITKHELKNLYNILDYYVFNSAIIEKEKIPITFVYQIDNFLKDMSNLNILSIEKENLLLTCYKNLYNKEQEGDIKTYKKYNKTLKCDNFLNKKKSETIDIPKYKEWIKIFNFE